MSKRIVNDPSLHGWTEENGKWVWDGGEGSAGLVISNNEPSDKVEGMQWLENTTGKVWIWDGSAWFQFPQGKDGAAGADGNIADATENGVVATWDDSAKQWTPDGAVVVKGGNATFSGTVIAGGASSAQATLITAPTVGNGQYSFAAKSNVDTFLRIGRGGTGADSSMSIANNWNRDSGNFVQDNSSYGSSNIGFGIDGRLAFGTAPAGGSVTTKMTLDEFGNLTVSGTINGVRNVIGTRDLIETLATLRASTLDETVDVRQALASACDKLIEKFESMQEVATQEIQNDA